MTPAELGRAHGEAAAKEVYLGDLSGLLDEEAWLEEAIEHAIDHGYPAPDEEADAYVAAFCRAAAANAIERRANEYECERCFDRGVFPDTAVCCTCRTGRDLRAERAVDEIESEEAR